MENITIRAFSQVCTVFEDGFDVWACNFCGAHAESPDKIDHYPVCPPASLEVFTEKEVAA